MSDNPLHDFLEVLAHGLRKPLAPVKAAAEELRMTAPDPNSQRIGELILRQVGGMDRILEALLDVSRLERGRLRTVRGPLDLYRVLEAAVEECRPALDAKSQRLVVELPDEPLQVEGDEPRLVQIMRNLLDNAVKFTPEAGSIHLSIAAAGSHAEIQVQDTGCGMTPTLLSRLFDPFAVATSTAHTEDGLGLGLIITKHLVELHDGTLTAHSDGPGQGAQFCVSLPLVSAPT